MKNLHPPTKLTCLLAVACLALAPVDLAVTPPPDGGYANQNTAEGEDALFSVNTGDSNTAMGYHALYGNTTGFQNTANGVYSLTANTGGYDNTAQGAFALQANTIGGANTAQGAFALQANTTGAGNTADGSVALNANTIGYNNTAVGSEALRFNTTGIANTGLGADALQFNTTGSSNTAVSCALNNNTTGSVNTAIGVSALGSNTTGDYNIAVGFFSGGNLTTGSNNIDIGNGGVAGESGVIRIGTRRTHTKTFIAGISKATVAGGVGVVINTNGQLGTITSSACYKEAIKPMDKASESLLGLKPVTFRYKKELDPEAIPQFGLVAEQVAKVDPDLVARDEQGKPYTVRYEAVNAMLLNEFLKEHRKVEAQGADMKSQQKMIKELQSTVAALQSALGKQAAQLEKVNERLAASPPPLRVVENR